ncbi:hypothetical protein FIBSPDRAFT_712783, partial [Athelia psychrophila]
MSLYLCVDCGGSKTSAVICDADGAVVGRALSGPSNFAYLGIVAFTREVHIAVAAALQTTSSPITLPPAPGTPSPFARAWFGISGVDSPRAAVSAASALSILLALPIPTGPESRLQVANDTHLLAAPLRTHPALTHAMAVIGGTGAVCVSFDRELTVLGRVGGWGWILGDEGGGFHVGREAVRQLLFDADRATLGGPAQPPSVLKERILARFGLSEENAMEILALVHVPDPDPTAVPTDIPETPEGELEILADAPRLMVREKRLSSLPPLVFTAAFVDRDPFALRVLGVSARALADQIRILLRSPSSSSADEASPNSILASSTVLCFGGSLVGIPEYRTLILDILKEDGHEFGAVEFVDDVSKTGAEALA